MELGNFGNFRNVRTAPATWSLEFEAPFLLIPVKNASNKNKVLPKHFIEVKVLLFD